MDIQQEWQKLAVELGFEFRKEIRTYVELPSLHHLAARAVRTGDIRQVEAALANPMIKSLMEKTFLGAAAGLYRGFEFSLFRNTTAETSSHPAYYVNAVLVFKGDLAMGLDIQGGSLGGRLGKALFSGRYIKFPENPELDGLVSVKARDKDRARALLSSAKAQDRLIKLYHWSKNFYFGDRDLRWHERGEIISRDRALTLMNLMADAAEALY